MSKYAIVVNNIIKDIKNFDVPPVGRYIDGLPLYLPLVFIPSPSFNINTQKLSIVYTIFNDRVEVSYDVVQLTQAELEQLAIDAA